jgi:protein phosphatase
MVEDMTSSISPPTHYLWAAGTVANAIPVGDRVDDRYLVIAPQLWQDTQPDVPPPSPEALPDSILPYARLYTHRLHIPEVYSVIIHPHGTEEAEILLLDNIPITAEGKLQPALTELWAYAPAVRQVYWLWQLLELWTPLSEQGVAASLLNPDNLRVEGWRIRLLELLGNGIPHIESIETKQSVSLAMLAALWTGWCATAREAIRVRLTEICEQMQQPEITLEEIQTRLNRLLLEQAAQLPLSVELAGLSDAGPQRDHNEDSCYPTLQDLQDDATNQLLPYLAIVCDGVGGHDGGEVASQQAVQTLKLLIQALLWDVSQQPDLQSPELIMRRLEACVRLVNNQIAAQNDQQGREMRQRMGTTLVMALQLPQLLPGAESQPSNAHELYLCNVGDSRAYWMTSRYCHQLTIDDDIAARDVRVGYSLCHEALRRSDSGILTQAVGTRNASSLRPSVQRFILEEDGILLLCSDGLSDNDVIEQCWQDYAEPILKGELSLIAAVRSLIDLANQRNGHDNTSVILMLCRIYPLQRDVQLFQPGKLEQQSEGESLSEASQALLDLDNSAASVGHPALPATSTPAKFRTLVILVVTTAFLLGFGITGLWTWLRLDPSGFQQWRDRVLPVNPR